VRLLLDEMYTHMVAEQLRARGHDADAASERAELRGLADVDLFALAQTEHRSLVTEDIADFSAIADGYDLRGQAHFGLVLLSPGGYPRGSPGTIGRMVTELDRLLGEHPEQIPTSPRHWL
jgi:hypothetical protein